jgi:SAM-dependent methyltransferase
MTDTVYGEAQTLLSEAYAKIDPYQPLYGAPLEVHVLRKTQDRCEAISRYFGSKLKGLRILDIGCNAGYVAFYLADNGAKVTAWDYDAKNIAVCNLVKQMNGIDVTFALQQFDLDTIQNLPAGQFDVACILSVLHWTVDESGLEYVQDCLVALFEKIPTLVVELALKDEVKNIDIYEHAPENALAVFDKVPGLTFKKIGDFETHQHTKLRPMYVISKKV